VGYPKLASVGYPKLASVSFFYANATQRAATTKAD
jgi:hypothetical protein